MAQTDPTLVEFAQALLQALAAAQDQMALARSLQETYHLFRHTSSEGHATILEVAPGQAGPLLLTRAPDPSFDVRPHLPKRDRDRMVIAARSVFERAQLRAIVLLPGLSWKELAAGIPIVMGGHDVAAKLGSRHILRLLLLANRPTVQTDRRLSGQVLRQLTLLHGLLQTIQRFGPGEEDPKVLLRIVSRNVMGTFESASEARSFLASLDLPTRELPPQLQQTVLELMVHGLTNEDAASIVASAERAVAAAGGPERLGAQADDAEIPLVGYHVVAQAIRASGKVPDLPPPPQPPATPPPTRPTDLRMPTLPAGGAPPPVAAAPGPSDDQSWYERDIGPAPGAAPSPFPVAPSASASRPQTSGLRQPSRSVRQPSQSFRQPSRSFGGGQLPPPGFRQPSQPAGPGSYRQASRPSPAPGGFRQPSQPAPPPGGFRQPSQPAPPPGGFRQPSQPAPPPGGFRQPSQPAPPPPNNPFGPAGRAAPARGTRPSFRQPSQSFRQPSHLQPRPRTQQSGLHRLPPRTGASGLHRLPQQTTESGLLRVPPRGRPEPSGAHRMTASARGVAPSAESGSHPHPTGEVAPRPTFRRRLDPEVGTWVTHFRTHGHQLLEKAERFEDAESYLGALRIVANVAGAFLDAGRWNDAIPIVRLLAAQERQSRQWPDEQRRALSEALRIIFPPEGVEAVVQALPETDFSERSAVVEMISYYGVTAVVPLIDLMTSRRLTGTVRREAAACVEAVGPKAGPALMRAVKEHGRRWNRVAPLITLLGATGFKPSVRLLVEQLKHPQPKIREEVIVALYKVLGDEAHRYLRHALDDPDAGVCQKAIALLAAAGSADANFTGLIRDLISIEEPENPREEGLIITAITALQDLGNIQLDGKTTAEAALLDALRGSWGGGLLGALVGGGRGGRSPSIQEALCETLGELGGAKARQALHQTPRDASAGVRAAAMAAAKRIAARLEAQAAS